MFQSHQYIRWLMDNLYVVWCFSWAEDVGAEAPGSPLGAVRITEVQMTDVESDSEAESPSRMAAGMDEPDEGRGHPSPTPGLVICTLLSVIDHLQAPLVIRHSWSLLTSPPLVIDTPLSMTRT
jgi:hypothetical protein